MTDLSVLLLQKCTAGKVEIPTRCEASSTTDLHLNLLFHWPGCLRSLHTQAVTEAISNYTPNRVLETPPPDISPLESFLPRSVRTTLSQLRSGHCRLLKSYMARITTGVSDVCPECGVARHSVEHLFNCSAHPTQLTVQDLWDNPAEVADFLNLDSWRQWTRREELLGYHNNNNLDLWPTGKKVRSVHLSHKMDRCGKLDQNLSNSAQHFSRYHVEGAQ